MASPPRYPFPVLLLGLALVALMAPALLRADGGAEEEEEARKTYIFRVDHSAKPSVFPTHAHWYASAAFASAAPGATPLRPLHVYGTVFHGFSASVPASRAEELRRHPAVLAAFEDRARPLHTTRSPQFMGLRARLGLWSLADYGSDVIVGVLDTGVWPERRSLSDRNLPPVPASNGSVEFMSPRDADGHGTHTATTAAGSVAYGASMEGYAPGVAKGVAPKARVAAYKVCWKGAGCMDSDILAGFDRAVADGVDVISVSIGGGSGVTAPFYLDPIAIGAYGAVSRGVFVATSAGNEGPASMSVTNLAPWLATVGAGTIDRNFPAEIVLGDGRRLSGVSLYSGKPLTNSSLPLYYPGRTGGLSASLCMENSIDPSLVKGKIVVCDRGSSPRVAKGMVVKEAGGAAMVLTNGEANGEGLVGDAHVLPACAVGEKEGDAVKAYAANASSPMATISFGGTVVGVKPAPVVASFSARGPNGLVPEILKPDFIAPGVNILAAWTGATGPTGLEGDTRRTEFNILSGTSMACPHASGAAALLRSAHPGWSPAAIRSALMTTAIVTDNRGGPVGDEAEPGRGATPFDYGAGHITLGKALDPGLVYDAGEDDYVAFMCSIGYEPNAIEVVTHKPVACPATASGAKASGSPSGSDLNYPSISVVLRGGNQSRTVTRTVTNVGAQASATYTARVQMASSGGVTVSVKPQQLVFSPGAKKQSFAVTVTAPSAQDAAAPVYGFLVWSDGGGHDVRSPIVVTWLQPM
uniref:Subtilisin-like protease SBT1.6 n=1 Tax=Zea mays TaxID=4577 RepID=A0A804LGZ3_MAIZE